MSKITYIGGDLIEEIGGSYKIFAKEGYEITSGKEIIFNAKEGISYGEPSTPPEMEDNSNVLYETDGHYSTVYLVCLMLGMSDYNAEELAIAAEAPDTTIHNESDFELNDTWFDPTKQEDIHTLTGGFHGVEEFTTALKFLWLKDRGNKKETTKRLGELLHRFGDTYAHTKFDNLKPENLSSYDLHKSAKNEMLAIESWTGQGTKKLSEDIEPWITFINFYTKKYGYIFLTNEEIQKKVFKNNKTLEDVLHDIYLLNSSDKFVMYGEKKEELLGMGTGRTGDHFVTDRGYPDLIYMRPEWYLCYVKNLAWLLSIRYKLNEKKLNISVFEKMMNFISKNKCSMKGIIDFEIAKIRKKKVFYIPVFYSSPNRTMASVDAVFNTNYMGSAEDAKNYTLEYMKESGINGIVEEIKGNVKISFMSDDFFYRTKAFKIKY